MHIAKEGLNTGINVVNLINGANIAGLKMNPDNRDGAAIFDAVFLMAGGADKEVEKAATNLVSDALKSEAENTPATLARVVPGNISPTTLARPGEKDAFVTAAQDIRGTTPKQISETLGIPNSKSFTVIKFPAPASGVASPINRENPGFVGKGVTSGGAREFVVPNGPIPANSSISVVGGSP